MDVNLSVIKRSSSSIDEVVESLEEEGFAETSSVLNGMVRQHENGSGFSLTAVDGPLGTLVVPSGPIRGALLGENAVGIGDFVDRVSSNTETRTENGSDEESNRGSNASSSYGV